MLAKNAWSQAELGKRLGEHCAHGKYSQAQIGKVINLNLQSAGADLFEASISLFGIDPDYFFEVGPIELDPAEYSAEKRKTVAARVESLERALSPVQKRDPESGTRTTTSPVRQRGSR